ncbi:MAG: sensor domain-containing diguanylate cyclase [Deltaproteobacteria bacterium]|jgi:diguanylate cyclase (GGDEF)-like protein|nr:sensor domain-containing diguanylate cyclase [Deltaproteobacteria bacterium]
MSEQEIDAPIPVLLVGEGASAAVEGLMDGLEAAGNGSRFSCASFDSAAQAADASAGASLSIVIGFGPRAEAILADPVWEAWRRPGAGILPIAVCGSPPAAATPGEGDDTLPGTVYGTLWIHTNQGGALPAVVGMAAGLLEAERAREDLSGQLETERACEPLSDCLEPGKLYPMALEILLERLGRQRGVAVFAPSPAPQSPGIATRGFEEPVHENLCRELIEEKALDAVLGQGEIGVLPFGPLHHVLGRVGVEAPGALLSVPLRGEEQEVGHLWILSEGRRFDAAELETARVVAQRAGSALSTAERYHHAKERAFIDDVTGVYNARYLLATADNEIQRAARYGNPLSVLFLDLDRFKTVNDRYGHLVGSETLRSLSRLLGECVRQVDTLARYGGDEFTILLVDTPHETALRIAERIRRAVEEHVFEIGREAHLRLTISIGVGTCPEHGGVREELLDSADKAMYRAKSEGRNRVCSAGELGERGAAAS